MKQPSGSCTLIFTRYLCKTREYAHMSDIPSQIIILCTGSIAHMHFSQSKNIDDRPMLPPLCYRAITIYIELLDRTERVFSVKMQIS